MLEKIKLYCKKEKLNKLKLITLPFVISTVLLTGCNITSSRKTNDTKYETNIDYIDEVDEQTIIDSIEQQYQKINQEEIIVESIDEEQLKNIDTYISLEENDLININDKIDDKAEYKYSEYFEISDALKKYDEFEEKETFSNVIIENNKVNTDKLYEIIIRNNKLFLNEGVNNSIFTEFSNSEVMEICNIISKCLNEKISKLEFDINELDSVLCSLKILSYDKYEYATITLDNCLAINKTMINSLNVENALEKTITHESMHLIQKSSEDEKSLEGYSKNIGMNYMWEDLKVNSLYNDWLIESSAEKSASILTGEEINYEKKIAYLDALEITMAFEDFTMTDLDLSKNLNQFYESFSCNGLVTREEIATMMYAIDFINTNDMLITEESEFLTNYKNLTGNDLMFKEQQELKKQYTATIYKTLSKKLYYDLTQKLNSGEIKVTDAFSMIVLFETSCAKNTWYYLDERLPYNEDFIKEYNDLQQTFFEVIANKINMSKEDVQKTYNAYHNYDIIIDFTSKNSYLNSIYEKIKQNKSVSINQIYQSIVDVKKY